MTIMLLIISDTILVISYRINETNFAENLIKFIISFTNLFAVNSHSFSIPERQDEQK